MRTRVDAAGRIAIPKTLQESTGIGPGSTIEVSLYGNGLVVLPSQRTAELQIRNGHLVAFGGTVIDDDTVTGLIDEGRR